MKQPEEMICKRLKKDPLQTEDEYENVTDRLAFTAMFPLH